MRIESIYINNLLSYGEAHMEFGDYNVIVGPNDSGKTNLLRIVQAARGRLSDFHIPRGLMPDPGAPSQLVMDVLSTSEELGLVLQTLLPGDVRREFPEESRRIRVLVSWGPPAGADGAGSGRGRPGNAPRAAGGRWIRGGLVFPPAGG